MSERQYYHARRTKKVHIINEDRAILGRFNLPRMVLCGAEISGVLRPGVLRDVPKGYSVCQICERMEAKRQREGAA